MVAGMPVRVPHANRLGEPGDGWKVAVTTLMNERTTIGGAGGGGGSNSRRVSAIQEALDLWRKRADHDGVHRDRLAQLWIDNEILRLTIQMPDHRLLAIQSLDPQDDDSLIDELLASNPKFQALVAKSKASPRKPFAAGERGLTNG